MIVLKSVQPTVRSHCKAHTTVITNECWYGESAPFFGKAFTAKKAIKRHREISRLLERAAEREAKRGNDEQAAAYQGLHSKLSECRPRRRCGSSACPKCARAFQRAKVTAHIRAIAELTPKKSEKTLVLVTIIPPKMMYSPGDFLRINPRKANRWLRDKFDRSDIRRPVIGSIDLGWEKRGGEKYLQLHWHLAMWTKNRKALKAKLDEVFNVEKVRKNPRCKRLIDVKKATDLDFIPYMNKLIKLPTLLRAARRQLPELLLLLGRFDSMDFIFLRRMRLSAQADGIVFKKIKGTPEQKVVTRIRRKWPIGDGGTSQESR
jgi:hypothetical protein